MPITKRLRGMAANLFDLGVLLISDAIDSWSSGESREQLLDRLRDTAERAAELALENERLHDINDGLRFNGPTLWKDEVELLKEYATVLRTSLAFNNLEDPAMRKRDLEIIDGLLRRCDHMPMTAQEMGKDVDFFPGERDE